MLSAERQIRGLLGVPSGTRVTLKLRTLQQFLIRFRHGGYGSLFPGNQSALTTEGGLRLKRVVQGYQRGYLRVRNGQYELLYRDLILGADGRVRRPRRTVQLGPETIGSREAERLRDDALNKMNK